MVSPLKMRILGALAAVALATPATAAQIYATSYDTPNGSGQASGGSLNYWDIGYTGAGLTTTDGAALTGGLGDLTDGVVATDFWFNTENGAGTGPYVGWYAQRTLNPFLTFNFAGNPFINTISIHLDNSQFGGVVAPAAILVDGASQIFTAPAPGTIGTVNLTGLNLSGGSHTIQFMQPNSNTWTFVSEISFFGTAVPEPATWAMMIGGFGLVGATMRRRRIRLA